MHRADQDISYMHGKDRGAFSHPGKERNATADAQRIQLKDLGLESAARKIVVFKEPGLFGTIQPLAHALQLSVETLTLSDETGSYRIPDELGDIEVLPTLGIAIVGSMDDADLAALTSSSGVAQVITDAVIGIPEELAQAQDGGDAVLSATPLQTLSPALARLGIGQTYGLRGDGVIVAIIDTGIDGNHPDFHGRFNPELDFKDFTATEFTTPTDDHGHGTHCAGIIGGPRAGNTGYGVAPGCRLVIGRALRRRGSFATGLLSGPGSGLAFMHM